MNDNNLQESSDVGYGRPPIHTRFKKGQSGNPAGRCRVRQDRSKVFEKVLRSRTKVRKNGRLTNMTKAEVIIHQAVNQAASGDIRAFEFLLRILRKLKAPPVRRQRPRNAQESAAILADRLRDCVLGRPFEIKGDCPPPRPHGRRDIWANTWRRDPFEDEFS